MVHIQACRQTPVHRKLSKTLKKKNDISMGVERDNVCSIEGSCKAKQDIPSSGCLLTLGLNPVYP